MTGINDQIDEPLMGRVCTQPDCVLRDERMARRGLAEIVVGVMAGENSHALVSDDHRIERKERCVDCTLLVMKGGRAFPTEEEARRQNETAPRRWPSRRRKLQRGL
jgi:hypothetical protein